MSFRAERGISFVIYAIWLIGCSSNVTGTPQPGLANPLAQFIPTNTPYATYTPYSTLTAYPTYTPFPTSTALPTPTATPTPIPLCNPSWRNPESLDVNSTGSLDQATKILENEIKRSTNVASLPSGQNWVQVYVTMLTPQLTEAIVVDKAARESLTPDDSRKLLAEFDRKLDGRNIIPFLLTIRGKADANINMYFGPLEKSWVVVNQRQQEIRPLHDYVPALASIINLASGGTEGYFSIQRSVGERCTPTINLLDDFTVSVRATNISLWKGDPNPGSQSGGIFGGIQLPFLPASSYRVGASWAFTLLPAKPLVSMMNTPVAQPASGNIESTVLTDIAGLARATFKVLMGN